MQKRSLCRFFNCSWAELHEIDMNDWREALVVLEVEGEIWERDKDKDKR